MVLNYIGKGLLVLDYKKKGNVRERELKITEGSVV